MKLVEARLAGKQTAVTSWAISKYLLQDFLIIKRFRVQPPYTLNTKTAYTFSFLQVTQSMAIVKLLDNFQIRRRL